MSLGYETDLAHHSDPKSTIKVQMEDGRNGVLISITVNDGDKSRVILTLDEMVNILMISKRFARAQEILAGGE